MGRLARPGHDGAGRAVTEEIAADLERAAQDVLAARSSFYWEVVAGSFVSRGRSFAQLSSYAEAGIERYLIEAVLDKGTTEICRFLHGKSISVTTGLRTFDRVDAEPDLIKDLTPWVREAVDPQTGAKSLFVERGDERVRVADVARSAVGTRVDRGEFGGGPSDRDLANLGISFPPYHGLCRTTTVAGV